MSNKDRQAELLKRLSTLDNKLDQLLIATAKISAQYPELPPGLAFRGEPKPQFTPGDPSTYPSGPWPKGTVERVREFGLSQQQSTKPTAAE